MEPQSKKQNLERSSGQRTHVSGLIRTSIGIMGFDFVVVKFSLFVRQITAVLGHKAEAPSAGYSPVIGILLVTLGDVATLFSYIRYNDTKKQYNAGTYYHSSLLIQIMTAVIFLVSVLLVLYLVKSI